MRFSDYLLEEKQPKSYFANDVMFKKVWNEMYGNPPSESDYNRWKNKHPKDWPKIRRKKTYLDLGYGVVDKKGKVSIKFNK